MLHSLSQSGRGQASRTTRSAPQVGENGSTKGCSAATYRGFPVDVHVVGDQAVMFRAVQLLEHQERLAVPVDVLDSLGKLLKEA